MKKILTFNFILFVAFSVNSQIINPNCWNPAIFSHCEINKQKMDNYTYNGNNTFQYHAVFQASENCVYLQWNFPLWSNNYLVGLKIRIIGGGINDEVIIYNCPPAGNIWPFYDNYGNYTYTNQIASDPSAVQVIFIYSELDWGACTYKGMKYQNYFGYPAPLCVSSGSFQNEEDNDFGVINIDISEKVAGLYPTVVEDYINITKEEDITSVEIIDINGKLVKKFDNNYEKYNLSSLMPGIYIVRVKTVSSIQKNYKIVKR